LSQQQTQTKCKFCNLNTGLEWAKTDEGKNILRYVGDKEPHWKDCKKIQARETGYSFVEVINRHKGSNSGSGDQTTVTTTSTKEQGLGTIYNTIDSKALADTLRTVNEIKEKLTSVDQSVNSIKELMWFIPEIRQHLQENVKDNFVSASEEYKKDNMVIPSNKNFEETQ
jgi:hypothetical protein